MLQLVLLCTVSRVCFVSAGCITGFVVLCPPHDEAELHAGAELHAWANRELRSNDWEQQNQISLAVSLKQQELTREGASIVRLLCVRVRLKPKETRQKSWHWTSKTEGGRQQDVEVKKKEGKSTKKRGTNCASLHLSPHLYCFSRCLIVYCVKPKAFSSTAAEPRQWRKKTDIGTLIGFILSTGSTK